MVEIAVLLFGTIMGIAGLYMGYSKKHFDRIANAYDPLKAKKIARICKFSGFLVLAMVIWLLLD